MKKYWQNIGKIFRESNQERLQELEDKLNAYPWLGPLSNGQYYTPSGYSVDQLKFQISWTKLKIAINETYFFLKPTTNADKQQD